MMNDMKKQVAIEEKFHKWVRVQAAMTEKTQGKIVEELIEAAIKREGKERRSTD